MHTHRAIESFRMAIDIQPHDSTFIQLGKVGIALHSFDIFRLKVILLATAVHPLSLVHSVQKKVGPHLSVCIVRNAGWVRSEEGLPALQA